MFVQNCTTCAHRIPYNSFGEKEERGSRKKEALHVDDLCCVMGLPCLTWRQRIGDGEEHDYLCDADFSSWEPKVDTSRIHLTFSQSLCVLFGLVSAVYGYVFAVLS